MSRLILVFSQQLEGKEVPIPEPISDLHAILLSLAEPYVGIPYQWDGHGNPGWDCSEWVSYIYEECFDLAIPGYTDSIALESDLYETDNPKIGDVVLYRYHDEEQPYTTYPHTGIYLDDQWVLDSRWPDGVNVHRHLNTKKVFMTSRKEN